MNAKDAINTLKPKKWAKTPPADRLRLLELVRENLKAYGDALATSDSKMKNELIGEQSYTNPISKVGTVVPMANTVSAAIELYEGLVHGEMPEPLNMRQDGGDNASDPIIVTEAIYAAATDGTKQLRYIAGPDAEQLIAARKQMGDPEYLELMKGTMGL